MLINTISKMVVGLDKSQIIKTEVEEWSRKRGERAGGRVAVT
jgi:hypothetical protein